jgi:hypothetical protein
VGRLSTSIKNCVTVHAFSSDDDRRRAWFQHRDKLLIYSGTRPARWWDCEAATAGVAYPDDEAYESAALFEHGLLTPAEVSMKMDRWRYFFEVAQQPRFSCCVGSGRWLEGEEARQAPQRRHRVSGSWRNGHIRRGCRRLLAELYGVPTDAVDVVWDREGITVQWQE